MDRLERNNSGSRRSGILSTYHPPAAPATRNTPSGIDYDLLSDIADDPGRPSPTTWGKRANRLFSNTICATAREAGLLRSIATPMSASLRRITPLTPSAGHRHADSCDCRACTIARFWSGRTRQNWWRVQCVGCSLRLVGSARIQVCPLHKEPEPVGDRTTDNCSLLPDHLTEHFPGTANNSAFLASGRTFCLLLTSATGEVVHETN